MDLELNSIETDDDGDAAAAAAAEFWPIQHPTEPPDEDQPVKCPMPDSSVMNDDGATHERKFSESLRRRGEISAVVNKGGRVAAAAEPPPPPPPRPIRVVRRRHHSLTHGSHAIVPLTTMPHVPPPPPPVQSITILQMLQQFDEFDS